MDNLNHYLDEKKLKSYLHVDNTVFDAVMLMRHNNTSYVIVQDKGKDIGIFTETDLKNRVAVKNTLPSKIKLSEVMTKQIEGIDASWPIHKILKQIERYDFHHIPVLKKGSIIAVLNARTILKIALKNAIKERQYLMSYITGSPEVSV